MTELNLLLTNTVQFTLELLNGFSLSPSDFLHSVLIWIQSLGQISGFVFILIYIISTIALVPGSILTLGAGVVFGVVWGSVYVLIGAIIGETLAFLLARYLFRNQIAQKIAVFPRFVTLEKALNQEGLKIILLTRLSPIFPFSLLNYAFGITGISLRDYFLGSIGMIPMTITYVYLGSLAGNLATIGEATGLASPELQWRIKIIGFLATMGATIYITHLARITLNKSLAKV